MKIKNLTKLPIGFTAVAVMTLCLSVTQLAGASGDHSASSHDNLNFNKVNVDTNLKMSEELKSQKFFGINLNDLLDVYTFPNDKYLMYELYKKASQSEGDYTSLLSKQNPFSKYMSYEIYSVLIDQNKKWKEFSENVYKNEIDSSSKFNLNRKIFLDLPSGLNIKSVMQINPQLSPGGCETCTPADYKPIAKDGISLSVICMVNRIKSDNSTLYSYNDKDPLTYTTGVRTSITSKTEKIDIETPVINSAITEEIRVKYCHNQETQEVKVEMYCKLEPSTKLDKTRLLSSFNENYIALAYFEFTLKNFKKLFGDESMAKNINPKVSLASVKSREETGEISFLGIDGHYETIAYEFPKFRDTTVYSQSEAELADMVRRSYVTGYEELKKKENQGN